MKGGCPKEIKNNENRVGLTPNVVQAYVASGHTVTSPDKPCRLKSEGIGKPGYDARNGVLP